MRHEETAAFAAAADAALTGELAVCAGSCGPGNLHLINGLFDAQRSRVPVLAIAAHIPLAEIGSEYFQETHPQELFRECSVYCELVSTPEQAPRILEMAMRAAVEEQRRRRRRRSPARSSWPTGRRRLGSRPVLPARSVCDPRRALRLRQRPCSTPPSNVTILAGAGVAGAHDEVVELAGTLQAPIVHALRGKEHVEYDNPYDVGMTGLLGFASGYKAIKEADVLLMLGTDFPYQQFYPEQRQDHPGRHPRPKPGRRTPIDLGLVGTVGRHRGRVAAAAGRQDRPRPPRPVAARTTPRPAGRWTRWPSTTATAPPSGRNTLRHWPIGWPTRTRCSPSTSARRWCGRRAT